VIAWSLNPPTIIKTEEHKCSTLKQRLEAARKCSKAGYKLAFHFDPVILHEGWEKNYKAVVDKVFDYVHAGNIFWISLGVLRFTPAGKTAIQKRFPNTSIIYEEMVPCQDGKLRYLQPVRIDIYRKMVSWIRSHDKLVYVYLCMESPAVWERVFGSNSTARKMVVNF